MKITSIRAAVSLTILLVVLLLIMSCAPGAQNTNQSLGQNQNDNQNANRAGNVAVLYSDACDPTNMNTKIELVQARIDEDIARDDELKEGRVKVQVRKATGGDYLELLVEGFARGEDELNDLTHILKKFMNKDKNCVLRVVFVPTGTIPALANSDRLTDFQWSACEWPKIACPSGVCAKACPSLTPQIDPTPNSTRSPNADSNAGVNR